jgi:hypothetical protein
MMTKKYLLDLFLADEGIFLGKYYVQQGDFVSQLIWFLWHPDHSFSDTDALTVSMP